MSLKPMVSAQEGMTLIELMIVVVIVAVLAAIAYPAYTDYVLKARRADAHDSLLYLQTLQEKYRANNTDYGEAADLGVAAPMPSNESYYNIAISGVSATGYTLTATAVAPQNADTDCATITLTVAPANPRGDKGGTTANCW